MNKLIAPIYAIGIIIIVVLFSFILANQVSAGVTVRPSLIGISQSGGYGTPHTIAVLDSYGNVWITKESITGKWSEWLQLKPVPPPKEVQ